MAPTAVFDRARRQMTCHPGASLVITDAWKINPTHHECEVICSKCGHSIFMDISRKEYQQMDNRKPWEFKQEGRHAVNG